jgi:hypothetical protein
MLSQSCAMNTVTIDKGLRSDVAENIQVEDERLSEVLQRVPPDMAFERRNRNRNRMRQQLRFENDASSPFCEYLHRRR